MKTRETMATSGNTKKRRKQLLVASAEEQYAGGGWERVEKDRKRKRMMATKPRSHWWHAEERWKRSSREKGVCPKRVMRKGTGEEGELADNRWESARGEGEEYKRWGEGRCAGFAQGHHNKHAVKGKENLNKVTCGKPPKRVNDVMK